ncbi:unnamed protein product [Closterium sp. NIES-53]
MTADVWLSFPWLPPRPARCFFSLTATRSLSSCASVNLQRGGKGWRSVFHHHHQSKEYRSPYPLRPPYSPVPFPIFQSTPMLCAHLVCWRRVTTAITSAGSKSPPSTAPSPNAPPSPSPAPAPPSVPSSRAPSLASAGTNDPAGSSPPSAAPFRRVRLSARPSSSRLRFAFPPASLLRCSSPSPSFPPSPSSPFAAKPARFCRTFLSASATLQGGAAGRGSG